MSLRTTGKPDTTGKTVYSRQPYLQSEKNADYHGMTRTVSDNFVHRNFFAESESEMKKPYLSDAYQDMEYAYPQVSINWRPQDDGGPNWVARRENTWLSGRQSIDCRFRRIEDNGSVAVGRCGRFSRDSGSHRTGR